jgi:hypothetical protein
MASIQHGKDDGFKYSRELQSVGHTKTHTVSQLREFAPTLKIVDRVKSTKSQMLHFYTQARYVGSGGVLGRALVRRDVLHLTGCEDRRRRHEGATLRTVVDVPFQEGW